MADIWPIKTWLKKQPVKKKQQQQQQQQGDFERRAKKSATASWVCDRSRQSALYIKIILWKII